MTGYCSEAIHSAAGGWVLAHDGRKYFDGSSGTINVNIGHSHPAVLRAISHQLLIRQAPRYGAAVDDHAVELSQLLIKNASLPEYKVYFTLGGTGANEIAYQLACVYLRSFGLKNTRIYVSDISYHGYSTILLQNSGHKRRKLNLAGMTESGRRFHAPYGKRVGLEHECDAKCADEIIDYVDKDGTGGVFIMEAISGTTGGALKPPPGYFQRLQQNISKSNGILIIDEVLTGLGRSGKGNTLSKVGIKNPHFVTLAKGVCCGYGNISAVMIRPDVAEVLESSGNPAPLTGTMAMSPIDMAAAVAVQKELYIITRSSGFKKGEDHLKTSVGALARLPTVEDVRGTGWYYGVELLPNARNGIINELKKRGIMLYPFDGRRPYGRGDGLVIAPPLNSSEEELIMLLSTMHDVLNSEKDYR